MKYKKNLLTILSLMTSALAFAQGIFNGSINFTITSNKIRSEVHYFFNENYVKKIDNRENFLSKAGYTEVIWDLNSSTQFIINHERKEIFKLVHKDLSPNVQAIQIFDSTLFKGSLEFKIFSQTSHNNVNLQNKEMRIDETSTYFISENLKIKKPIQSDSKFEPINLTTSYIPIRKITTAYISDSLLYTTIIEISKMEQKKIKDSFFQTPKDYKIREFDIDIIRFDVKNAINNRVDFRKQALEIIAEMNK
jgi:hypothetical protein